MARLTGVACLSFLLVSGCGTTSPNSSSGSSGSGASAVGAVVSTGPQLGLVWDGSDATLRPLSGVPGAASLGAPLFPAGTWAAGAFSVPSQTALLLTPQGNLQMMALPALQPQTVAQNVSSGSQIGFAPHGGWAVVFSPGSATALLIGGLPTSVTASVTNAGVPIEGAAVSDAGTLLLATQSGSGIAVSSISATGTRASVTTLQGFGGMSFVPGSENFVVADSAADTLTLWRGGAATVLASGASTVKAPFAVAISRDGRWAIVAGRGTSSNVVRVDLSGAAPAVVSTCQCSPSQLTALAGNAVFELSAPGGGTGSSPGWMVEADDATPRVLFIPPAGSGQ